MSGLAKKVAQKPEPEKVGLLIDDLREVPVPIILDAVKVCERTLKWFPSPAEFREIMYRPVIAKIPLALDAWGEVKKAFGCVGSWGTPTWSHPLIKRTVDSMGWLYLCESTDEMADRAHFLRQYQAAYEREKQKILEGSRLLDEIEAAQAPKALPKLELKGMD